MGGARKGQEPVWVITGYRRGRDTDIPVDLSKITGPVFFRGRGKRAGNRCAPVRLRLSVRHQGYARRPSG